jgi:PEGA domain
MMASRLAALIVGVALITGCVPQPRAAVSLKVVRQDKTPRDASVTIDEQYIGPLAYVAAHGVRLPTGEHRITIEREGYFPYDVAVVAGRDSIRLNVRLIRIPD